MKYASGLKERDLLPKDDTPCTVHDSLRWTVQQRAIGGIISLAK